MCSVIFFSYVSRNSTKKIGSCIETWGKDTNTTSLDYEDNSKKNQRADNLHGLSCCGVFLVIFS